MIKKMSALQRQRIIWVPYFDSEWGFKSSGMWFCVIVREAADILKATQSFETPLNHSPSNKHSVTRRKTWTLSNSAITTSNTAMMVTVITNRHNIQWNASSDNIGDRVRNNEVTVCWNKRNNWLLNYRKCKKILNILTSYKPPESTKSVVQRLIN